MPACLVVLFCFQNPRPVAHDPLQTRVALTDGSVAVYRTRQELGFRLTSKAPVTFSVDAASLQSALSRLAPKFRHEAVGARPVLKNGDVEIVAGEYARALDVAKTVENLTGVVTKNPAATRFSVSVEKTSPDLTPQKLKGITGVLAQYTTKTSDKAKRNLNIGLATESIDGTLLSPGETFSLNAIVGKRTQARGYRTATVFEDGRKVDGIGGGVSQVTGTLFNAAALAGLKIDEVHPHSRPVAYLPKGRDATVAYGAKDLKFTNATEAPVYIGYTFSRQTLQATIWGAVPKGFKTTLKPIVHDLGPGKIDAELYRTVRQGGKAIRKERLFRHQYRWTAGS